MKLYRLNQGVLINIDQICSIVWLPGSKAGASFGQKDEIFIVISLADGSTYRMQESSEEAIAFKAFFKIQ